MNFKFIIGIIFGIMGITLASVMIIQGKKDLEGIILVIINLLFCMGALLTP